MTTTTTDLGRGPGASGLVRSELLKIRTTNSWWWFALGALAWTLVALPFNMWFAYSAFDDPDLFGEGLTSPEYHAGNIYTSGQYLGLLFVMLIGILMVTNEFFHQTATMTFLTTPHRTVVIMNKLLTAVLIGVGFWVVTTLIDLAAGGVFLSTQDHGAMLGDWPVQRSVLLNLAAYGVWTVFGVAIGTLIRSQLAATIIATVLYIIGTQVAGLAFFLLSVWLDNETVLEWQVIVPSVASQVMTTGGGGIPGTPQWWVGALILLGYAIVAGVAGVLITRRRDIS